MPIINWLKIMSVYSIYMGGYIIDDGESIYKVDRNIPQVRQKILRRHKKVMKDISRVWKEIRDIMRMYINHGIDTDDLMKHYVKLFINQSRLHRIH